MTQMQRFSGAQPQQLASTSQNNSIQPSNKTPEVEYIDAEYVELDDSSKSSTVHSDPTASKFVMATQTAYSKYQELTSYNRTALFKADFEDYNNPYTDDKKESCIAQIKGSRPTDSFV